MGTYATTYVGIYLEIPFVKSERVMVTYKHPETGAKMKDKFCPLTGVKAIEKHNTEIIYFVRKNCVLGICSYK